MHPFVGHRVEIALPLNQCIRLKRSMTEMLHIIAYVVQHIVGQFKSQKMTGQVSSNSFSSSHFTQNIGFQYKTKQCVILFSPNEQHWHRKSTQYHEICVTRTFKVLSLKLGICVHTLTQKSWFLMTQETHRSGFDNWEMRPKKKGLHKI